MEFFSVGLLARDGFGVGSLLSPTTTAGRLPHAPNFQPSSAPPMSWLVWSITVVVCVIAGVTMWFARRDEFIVHGKVPTFLPHLSSAYSP